MIVRILSTAATRIITGFVLLAVLALQTRFLGLDAVADITLLKIALTFNNLVAAIFCGPVLVYLGNRYALAVLFLPALLWIIFSVFITTGIQYQLYTYPREFTLLLLTASFLFALQVFYENILLAREQIQRYNVSVVLHHSLLILFTWGFIAWWPCMDAYNYLYALHVALGVNALYLFIITFRKMKYSETALSKTVFIETFRLGFVTQLTNFIQTLNYRVSVLLLARYWSKRQVGYFGTCLQVAEAVWILAKSLAVIQYARLSVNTLKSYQVEFTLAFAKLCLILTAAAGTVLLILPDEVYSTVFGESLNTLQELLYPLMPGILCFSMVLSFSHYFSARGNVYMNLYASLLSLLAIGIGGWLLIPQGGEWAAAWVYSGGLALLLVFYILVFKFESGIYWKQFLIQASDIQLVKKVLRNSRKEP